MFNCLYYYENKNPVTNDRIREYCMAEKLNEEYFKYNMRKNESKNYSALRNIMAAFLLNLADIFKY